MLNVIAGILAKDPSIKDVKKGNENLQVSNNTIYIKTAEGRSDIPVNISAWGENAVELQKYKKGDSLHFVGAPNDSSYKNESMEKPITTLGYTVLKIDHNKTLLKEMDTLLSKYLEDGKEKKKEEQEKGREVGGKSKDKSSGKKKTADPEMAPGTPA
jgi:single-stranded DNA-binding protein